MLAGRKPRVLVERGKATQEAARGAAARAAHLDRLDRVREQEDRLELRERAIHVRQRALQRLLRALLGHLPLALLQAAPVASQRRKRHLLMPSRTRAYSMHARSEKL